MTTYVGTAGWNIPEFLKPSFAPIGTHLQRYAKEFNCVEINSSFYRDHKPETYVKWAASVPQHFRFSVKLSRYFIHEQRLKETGQKLKDTLDGIFQLKEKLGVLLVQLPPSLEFDLKNAKDFIASLRKYYRGNIVWEPRHRSWLTPNVLPLFKEFNIHKVIADPDPCPTNLQLQPLVQDFKYFRMHGSPHIYKSRYTRAELRNFEDQIAEASLKNIPVWFIFDNTTYGYATTNALELHRRVQYGQQFERDLLCSFV